MHESTKEDDNTLELAAKNPWLTYGFIALNGVVWLLLSFHSVSKGITYDSLLMDYGAKDNLKIISGDYWRFITPIFLHLDISHLLLNSISLWYLGRAVEGLYGHLKYFFIYIIAGGMGNIASFMFTDLPSVGASGSIFGLLGALLYLKLEEPLVFKRTFGNDILTMIGINILYGLLNPGIDNFAHLGGLAGGFLFAGSVKMSGVMGRGYLSRRVFLGMILFMTILGLYYGFNNEHNRLWSDIHRFDSLNRGEKWTEAENLGEKILASKPKESKIVLHVLWGLCIDEANLEKYDEAIAHAQAIIAIEPSSGHYMLGLLYHDTGQYEKSREELLQAKSLDYPEQEKIDNILHELERLLTDI